MYPETETVNESGGRYLRIDTDSTFDEFSYKMLRSINSDEFIKPELISFGTNAVISYNVTGCSSLSELAAERGSFIPKASDIIIRLYGAAKRLNNYLLTEDNIIIDKSMVFVDSIDKKIKLCVYPGRITEEEYSEGLRELVLGMLINTESEDINEIMLCIRLMKKTQKENVKLHELMTELVLYRNEKYNASDNKRKNAYREISAGSNAGDINMESYGADYDDETVYDTRINKIGNIRDENKDSYNLHKNTDDGRHSDNNEKYKEREFYNVGENNEHGSYGKYGGSDDYKSPYGIDELNDIAPENETGIPNIEKNNVSDSIKPKLIITQLIMLAGLAAVFLLKGADTVVRTLPIYAVLSVCTALYIIIGRIAEKKSNALISKND